MRLSILITTLITATLSSCVHYDDVVPGTNGLNVVTVQPDIGDESADEDELTEQATSQASDYCQDVYRGPSKIISTEKQPLGTPEGDDFKVVLKFRCL
jgi:hypothetical protein